MAKLAYALSVSTTRSAQAPRGGIIGILTCRRDAAAGTCRS